MSAIRKGLTIKGFGTLQQSESGNRYITPNQPMALSQRVKILIASLLTKQAKISPFGKITNTKNISLQTNFNDLAEKTYPIGWYYWMTPNNYAFLATGRYSKGGIRIYQHMIGGKWKPIHNARAFDGYPDAKSIFSSVVISDDARTIDIKYLQFNIPTLDNVLPRVSLVEDFKVTSNDFKNNEPYTGTSNPHIDWTNVPANTQSLALEVISLDENKAIWRAINIPPGDSNSSYIPNGAATNYHGMMTLENDIDFSREYSGFTPLGTYLVILYAVSQKNLTTMNEAKGYALKHTNMVFLKN